MMKLIHFFLPAWLLLVLACESSEESPAPVPDSLRTEQALFACETSQAMDLTEASSSLFFSELIRFGSDFLYGGLGHLQVRSGYDGPVLWESSDHPGAHLLAYGQQRVFVYGTDGIDEWLASDSLVRRSDVGFWELLLTADGTLLGIPYAESWQVVAIDPLDFSTQPYLDAYPKSGCVTLSALHQGPQGDFWAIDCDGDLLQFRQGELVQRETASASAFWGEGDLSPAEDQVFFLNHEDQLLAITKSASSFYEVLQRVQGEWRSLLTVRNLEGDDPSERELALLQAELYEAVLGEDQLLISTSRGMHQLDLRAGADQSAEDVAYFVDPRLPYETIHHLYPAPDDTWYLLNSQKAVVRLTSCE